VHPGHEQIDRPLARRETLTHETAAYAHERIHVTLGAGHIHVTLGAGRPPRPLVPAVIDAVHQRQHQRHHRSPRHPCRAVAAAGGLPLAHGITQLEDGASAGDHAQVDERHR
jgi:hypothetical protein